MRSDSNVLHASGARHDARESGTRDVLHAPRARRDNRTRLLRAGLLALVMLACVMVCGRLVHDVARVAVFSQKMLPPSFEHPFGTDQLGRDMLARTVAGLATSLSIGLVAAAASTVIALLLSVAAAIGGPRVDAIVAGLIDLMSSAPHLVLLILISCAAGRGLAGVTIGMALTHWPGLARVLRAEMRSVLARPYIAQSRSLGVGACRIAMAHLLPAVMPQVLVGAILALPHAVLHESSITFLGFGLSPDEPALGVILAEAMGYLAAGAWWLALFPGAVLALSVMLFAHVGELARSVLDPRSMQE